MRRNKKSQTGVFVFFGMMISIMIWIAFTQLLGPAKDSIEDARSVSQLDCGNGSISTGTKATCVIVDYSLFGWAGAVIALIIGAAGGGLLSLTKKKES